MLSKQKLYRYVVVGIIVAMMGAIASLRQPAASANSYNLSQAPHPTGTVYRDPNCGCCESWMEHLRANGFEVSEVQQSDMDVIKQEYNVPDDLASCHTAILNGAVFEGHVPAEDIQRFFSERSNAVGLAVPGMPIGSPGMESGDTQEPFTVYSFDSSGNAEIFSTH